MSRKIERRDFIPTTLTGVGALGTTPAIGHVLGVYLFRRFWDDFISRTLGALVKS
jgi:hypothetical protein